MASIWKHPDSPYWTACYTNHLGRRVKRSTKLTEKRAATKLALEWEDVEACARNKRLTVVQIQKVISDLSEKITGEAIDIPNVEQFLTSWLEGKKSKGSAPRTLERYRHTVDLFLDYLGELRHTQITFLTPKHVDGFLNKRLNAGVAPKTASVDLKTLRGAFNHAEKFGIILKNPVNALDLPEEVSMEREIFTHEEVGKLVLTGYKFGMEWGIVILFGYYTGARLTDCVRMKWGNLDFKTRVLTYTQGKTGKEVTLPLQNDFFEFVTLLHEDEKKEDFICPELAARSTGGRRGLSESFKRIMKKAGVDSMTVKGKGNQQFSKRSFHSLRYSFNSALANAGVTQEIRTKLTGHSSFAMNDRYTKLNMKTLEDAIDKIPSLEDKK